MKCCHPKFKKNEAFARYCEKTRAFANRRVISSATFRVSPVMSGLRCPKFFARCSLRKRPHFDTAAYGLLHTKLKNVCRDYLNHRGYCNTAEGFLQLFFEKSIYLIQQPNSQIEIARKSHPNKVRPKQITCNFVDGSKSLLCYKNQNPQRRKPHKCK